MLKNDPALVVMDGGIVYETIGEVEVIDIDHDYNDPDRICSCPIYPDPHYHRIQQYEPIEVKSAE